MKTVLFVAAIAAFALGTLDARAADVNYNTPSDNIAINEDSAHNILPNNGQVMARHAFAQTEGSSSVSGQQERANDLRSVSRTQRPLF